MKPSNGQGPTEDNDDFSDAAMIDSSLQDDPQAWQGHEAPIDDFNDPAAEGIAHVTEATETTEAIDADDSPASQDASTKSPMKWLPIATVIGGVIFIGAMLYLQFGSAPATSPLALLQQKPATANTQLPAAQEVEPAATVAPTTALTPLVTAGQANSSQAPSPSNAMGQKGVALPGTTGLEPASPPSAASTSAELNASVPAPKPSQNESAAFSAYDPARNHLLPTDREPLAPETQPATPMIATDKSVSPPLPAITANNAAPQIIADTPPMPAPVATAAPSLPGEARLASLTSQIENLQKELQATQQQLAQANARLQDIQSEKSAPSKAAATSQLSLLPLDDGDSFQTHKKQAASSSAKKKKPAASRKSSPSSGRSRHSSSRNADAHGPIWVLRAASPDEAWVGKGQDSRAIQPVRIGDTLSGVGRITAIRQDGDAWIVEGTQGIVR